MYNLVIFTRMTCASTSLSVARIVLFPYWNCCTCSKSSKKHEKKKHSVCSLSRWNASFRYFPRAGYQCYDGGCRFFPTFIAPIWKLLLVHPRDQVVRHTSNGARRRVVFSRFPVVYIYNNMCKHTEVYLVDEYFKW